MKTKAAILFELNKPLRIEEIEVPSLKRGQVLVKMLASGICRTQLNEIKGYKGEDKYLPHLLGHEGSGIVQEIGNGVTKLKKGDFVVVSWMKGKGLEGGPVTYSLNSSIINSGPVATFSRYAVISENRLTVLPDAISPEEGSLLGCAFPTGAGIIFNTLKPMRDNTVTVFGVGGVGLSAVMAAKSCGCKKIIAVDVHDGKLRYAENIGASDTVSATEGNIATRIRNMSGGRGTDFAVEASGNRQAMETAFEVLSDRGVLVIAGNLKSGEKISIDPFGLITGKRITGSWGGDTDPDRDIPGYAHDCLKGRIQLKKLISKRLPFEKINEAISFLEKGEVNGRVIITMS